MVTKSVRTEQPPADAVTNEQTAGQGDNAAQVESLATLTSEAKAIDAGPLDPGAVAPSPAVVVAQEKACIADVVDLLEMARGMAAPAAEMSGMLKPGQIELIWSAQALERIAKPLVSIMNRYDLGIEEALEKYMPWVLLIGGIVGPAFATFKAIKSNVAEAASAKQQQQPA